LKADLELKLIYDGEQWVASSNNGTITASGRSLDDLDEQLKQALVATGRLSPGSRINVLMKFDFDSIPTWYRQYHSHYFNRAVTFEL